MNATEVVPDADRVFAWLAGFKPRVVVGRAGDPSCCPLARYLNEMGMVHVRVGSDVVTWCESALLLHERHRATLPLWAQGFVRGVDTCGYRTITARRAALLLQRALA